MENSAQKPYTSDLLEDGREDLKKNISRYLKHWPWFFGSLLICLSLAFVYLRYATNIYESKGQIKILKDQSGLDLKGLQGYSPLIDMSKINLYNEISILNSRRIAEKVVHKLELTGSYYRSGSIKSFEIWENERPFIVAPADTDTLKNKATAFYNVEFQNLNEVKVSNPENNFSEVFQIGELAQVEGHQFIFNFNPNYKGDIGRVAGNTFGFKFQTVFQAVSQLTGQITITPFGERSEILDITIKGQNRHKNEAVVNALIDQFNEDGVDDNRLIAKRTEEFVIERLKYLVKELDTVEKGLVDYKSNNNLFEIENNAALLEGKNSETEKTIFEISSQLTLTNYFRDEILTEDDYKLLPSRIGIDNENINSYTQIYNDEVLERETLLTSSTSANPKIREKNNILDQLKINIVKTINNYIKSLEISLIELNQREQNFDLSIGKLPQLEKEIRIIERQQEVKQKLYLFLLQKREEAALSYAITAPIIKIVDYAYTPPTPVSPNSKIILFISVLLGLGLPFGILYVVFLLDTKIKGKDQIKSVLPTIPILAEVPQQKDKENKVILPNDRSSIAESFRIMRTNLNFMRKKDEHGHSKASEVVFVTSTTKGEGKTFIATSLASALVAAGNKVLLMGCDLRNPQIHSYFNLNKNLPGVSNFLYDDRLSLEDIIIHKPLEGLALDVILSGDIPPNPAEMLMNSKFKTLIESSKGHYDYIIVDTAPTILVTDTILISNYADITLYITRSGFTDTRLLPHIKDVQEKLINMGVVINGLDDSGVNAYNYGYGYGYGESNEKRKFWKFWKYIKNE